MRKASRFLPKLWLLTDAIRAPDPLPAIARLPRGAGVILRHHEWPRATRQALGQAIRQLTTRQGLWLLVARDEGLAQRLCADGMHLNERGLIRATGLARRHPRWVLTCAVHDAAALAQAARQPLDAVFLSPVFPTKSHPGAQTLGPWRFAALAGRSSHPVIALGGMNAARARLTRASAHGWASIFAPDQSESEVSR